MIRVTIDSILGYEHNEHHHRNAVYFVWAIISVTNQENSTKLIPKGIHLQYYTIHTHTPNRLSTAARLQHPSCHLDSRTPVHEA